MLFTNLKVFNFQPSYIARVGKLRSEKEKSAAREHKLFLNGMRPTKENFFACEHVNVSRKAKIFLS